MNPTRLITAVAWLGGASLGCAISLCGFLLFEDRYPAMPATFALFIAGAFLGMKVSDFWGRKKPVLVMTLSFLTFCLCAAMLVGIYHR